MTSLNFDDIKAGLDRIYLRAIRTKGYLQGATATSTATFDDKEHTVDIAW